jgi:hypothetical protein
MDKSLIIVGAGVSAHYNLPVRGYRGLPFIAVTEPYSPFGLTARTFIPNSGAHFPGLDSITIKMENVRKYGSWQKKCWKHSVNLEGCCTLFSTMQQEMDG